MHDAVLASMDTPKESRNFNTNIALSVTSKSNLLH